MLKVVIVDDEGLVRDLITNCIDWAEIGFKIVGTASTAAEAMDIVDTVQPDALFTDVRMPNETGLELGRAVLEKYPGIKVVIVSGYDEFNYVNEGLKMGIFDYILKPIAEEVLYDVACRVRDAILEERSHNEEFARLQEEFKRNYAFIKERQIERLVTSQNIDAVVDNLAFFDVALEPGCYQAAVLEYRMDEEVNQERDLLQSLQVREVVDRFFASCPQVFTFEQRFQRIGIINNQSGLDFSRLCDELRAELLQKACVPVRIGMGERYDDVRQLPVSYREARDILTHSFAMEMDVSIQYQEALRKIGEDVSIQDGVYHKFRYYIEQGMFREARDTLAGSFEAMKNSVLTREQVVMVALHYVMEIFSATQEMKVALERDSIEETKIIYELLCLHSFEDIQAYVADVIRIIERAIHEQNDTKTISVAQTVEEYVKEHYSDPAISLSQMAKMVYINPNYLSRVFKERTGKTFREYLSDLRMDKAVLLLRQTTLKSYEVAERVGIKDPSYFSVCFKKKFGQSVQSFFHVED